MSVKTELNVEDLTLLIEKLIGDTGVHGDSHYDSISYKNNQYLGELIMELVNNLSDSMISCFNDYRGSMKALARLKHKHLKSIYEEIGLYLKGCDES